MFAISAILLEFGPLRNDGICGWYEKNADHQCRPIDHGAGRNLAECLCSEGFHWTDRIMEGIRSVFDNEDDIEIFVTYMDTKRSSDKVYFSKLRDLYAHKYGFHKFDAIVSSDDHALNFLLKYRDELFPGTPVFFCGINKFHPSRIAGHESFTGVYETYDVAGTLDLMLQIHPKTKKIAVISDATFSGNVFKTLVRFFSS